MRIKHGKYTSMLTGNDECQKELMEDACERVARLCEELMEEARDSRQFGTKAEALVPVMNCLKNMTACAAVNVILEAYEPGEEPDVNQIGRDIANELHDVLQRHISENNKHIFAGN